MGFRQYVLERSVLDIGQGRISCNLFNIVMVVIGSVYRMNLFYVVIGTLDG
jgi:hypothetical protein